MTEISAINKKIDSSNFLIFDFDGVIADSVNVKTKAFAEIYKPYGEKVVAQVVSHHLGNGGVSRYEKFEYYHNKFLGKKVSDRDIANLSDYFSSLVVQKVVDSAEIPGALLFLNYYCKGRKKCAINSATPQIEIQEIIRKRGIQDFFSIVLGSPSTKLENLTMLEDLYEFNLSKALFFGDSESDMNAANSAKINFVGIGNKIISNLGKNDYHANDFMELLK
jgi:phosphoglycolate phosphatase-like HAD superfamily hydrolase